MATVINGAGITATAIDADEYSEDGQRKFACRAWVNFNGTTTPPTIRGSENVSSVARNGTGDYTINFTNAMVDADYAMIAQGGTGNGRWVMEFNGTYNTPDATSSHLSTSCRILYSSSGDTRMDNAGLYVTVFR